MHAIHCAKWVVAQVNPQMPRTHGNGFLHINAIDYVVESNEPLSENHLKSNPAMSQLARNVANLVEDEACLQLGIGLMADTVCSNLLNHRNLSIHSEMIGDGVVDLIKNGVVTNKYKKVLPDVSVTSFAVGTRKLYDLLDDNLSVHFQRTPFTNDPYIISQNDKVTAINGAIEVDITGQVCADSVGTKLYSGIGGQMDFMRGAAMSQGGKAILALPSTTNSGESRIAVTLKKGAGVVTTRAHVHYVVTEHGVAYLWGKNLQQRASSLINIAHPNHQEALEKETTETYGWNKNWKIHWQLDKSPHM
eukprot:TRINITY_DN4999_c0_g1_i4.p1 TRINITY_DN4999_c0_g1~~TRINITY_DN4999_c0_g1_i4.p1  ORF type:complete len:305 (+),score=67.64 TRINITY_DN4999_c0_g1_i4:734-1648(+)